MSGSVDLKFEGGIVGRIAAAYARACERAQKLGVPPPTLGEVCAVLMQRGLVVDERLGGAAVDATDQLVGQLTVRELARVMGVPDLDARRAAEAEAKRKAEAAVEVMERCFRDAGHLVSLGAPVRIRTLEEVDRWAMAMRQQIMQGAGTYSIAIAQAVLDDASQPYVPTPGSRASN